MAGVIPSKLTVLTRPWHANMTELNHLGIASLMEPHKFNKVLTRVFSATRIADNPMTAMLMSRGATETIESFDWSWELMGASSRPLMIVEDVEPSNTTKGIAKSEFKIKLEDDWFKPGDILIPDDKEYQVRVQRGPVDDGNGWIYTVVMYSDDDTLFLPNSLITPGKFFSKFFSKYEEYGDQSGSVTYSTPIKLRNQMSTYRKEQLVTADAANQALVVALMDADGKVHNDFKWMRYAEAEFWIQWYRELEKGLWYSKAVSQVPGANGRPVRSGAGIQEQLAESHVEHYTTLTERLIKEYLMDIFYGRVGFKSRNVVAYTGEYGMLAFDEALKSSANSFLTVDTNFIRKTSAGDSSVDNALEFGGQFVRYIGANGITLTLKHNPVYDDQEINRLYDSDLQVPVESMRFTFFDFDNGRGGNNIKLIKKKNGYSHGYVNGLYGPAGPAKGSNMANTKDGYTMVVKDQCGIQIDDITRCGELILSAS